MWRVSLHRLWTGLPWDGQGLFPPRDTALARLRRSAASTFWRRAPWWSRPLLVPVARLGWMVACACCVWKYARAQALPLKMAPRVIVDCLRSGARPNEALIWRQFFALPATHPLPGRAVARLLSQLGSPKEQELLADKQATSEMLAKEGLPVPDLLGIIPRGETPVNLASPLWSRPRNLFVKPCHGSGARGAMAVDVLASGSYRIDGGSTIDAEGLRDRLAAASSQSRDDLLVQSRLCATPELADLATFGVASVVRLTTARDPGDVPFLHSALLTIDVPGESPRNFIRGQVRVPINAATGRMGRGIWFLHPEELYVRLPWNGAPLADRRVPGLDRAVAIVLQAMALFPHLPLVNWDLIMTGSGPVILEGNTGGDWILTNLSTVSGKDVSGMETAPLVPLLRRWSDEAKPSLRAEREPIRTQLLVTGTEKQGAGR